MDRDTFPQIRLFRASYNLALNTSRGRISTSSQHAVWALSFAIESPGSLFYLGSQAYTLILCFPSCLLSLYSVFPSVAHFLLPKEADMFSCSSVCARYGAGLTIKCFVSHVWRNVFSSLPCVFKGHRHANPRCIGGMVHGGQENSVPCYDVSCADMMSEKRHCVSLGQT